MDLTKYSTSLSLNKELYALTKNLAMILQMKGIYINGCDIIEVGMKQVLEEYKSYLPQEYQTQLESINLHKRLPIIT